MFGIVLECIPKSSTNAAYGTMLLVSSQAKMGKDGSGEVFEELTGAVTAGVGRGGYALCGMPVMRWVLCSESQSFGKKSGDGSARAFIFTRVNKNSNGNGVCEKQRGVAPEVPSPELRWCLLIFDVRMVLVVVVMRSELSSRS